LEDDPGKDTPAPVITLRDFDRETSLPYGRFSLTVPTDVVAFYINGKLDTFGTLGIGQTYREVRDEVPLEMGANQVELTAVNFAGHETVLTLTMTRQGEIPEYVEQESSWAHYYYDENGELRESSKNNRAFRKPSDGSDWVAQNYMLAIIDEALLTATEDTPDYIEHDGNRLHFQNSISLKTLRDAIEKAELQVQRGTISFTSQSPVFLVDDKEMKWVSIRYTDDKGGSTYSLYYEYPDGTWWMAEVDSHGNQF
jgi:hypothetical protein